MGIHYGKGEKISRISMINSYNVITGKASINDIAIAGLGFFVHQPDEPVTFDMINYISDFFEEEEMFEMCAELQKIRDHIFNSDGTYRQDGCECTFPVITKYGSITNCDTCSKPIRV